ncbi:MAG TPA: hypothetical protein VNH64_04075 [Parvularculaceae bacterium]|nr:hypothetical protein [Parvularculaceae bacterium]
MLGQNGQPDTEKEIHAALNALRKDLEALRGDVSALRKDTLALGKAGARRATDSVEDSVDHLAESAKEKLRSTIGSMEGSAKDIKTAVQENPIASLSAAVVLGFLIGRSAVGRQEGGCHRSSAH